MNIQDKTKKELISELKESQKENNLLKTLCDEISSLRKKKMDLITYEIRYRSLFESAKYGILFLDAETGKIVDVNPFLMDLLGYNHDQFIEKSIWEIGIFKDIIDNQDKFIELRKNKYVRYNDLPLETKDGRIINVEFVSNVYLGDNQNVIQCNIRDITARKIIEKELMRAKKQAEEKGKNVTELGIVKKELNYQVEEKEKLHEELIITDKELTYQNELKEKREEELIIANKELVFQNKEKEKRANELENANKELAYQNDLKEKRAAELIIAKERAEESDRLKSAFLTNMSHEIRTPMNGILGFANLLKEPSLTGDEQQNYIRIIEKSGARMLNIINDIISISKIESGLTEINISESNINEQVEYIYTFFKPEVEGKGIQFSYKNSLPLSEAIIKTDREKLFAILTNLVKNAIKYCDKGSIELGCNKKGEFLEFYIKDSGIGINSDRQEAIFERFIQADIIDKDARQGAGLGLSISKAYVGMLGGELWVESKKGLGSTFYFTILYTTELQKTDGITDVAIKGVEEVWGKNLKILIVDDDKTSDFLISIMLTEISREILHAKSGLEAIELCRNNPDTDLILMDIKMPVMGGYDATRQIRQFNKDVIIIAQTAYGLTGDREKAMESGCNEHLSKPITKNELMSLVQHYFIK